MEHGNDNTVKLSFADESLSLDMLPEEIQGLIDSAVEESLDIQIFLGSKISCVDIFRGNEAVLAWKGKLNDIL